jgi:hypothetical protein
VQLVALLLQYSYLLDNSSTVTMTVGQKADGCVKNLFKMIWYILKYRSTFR